MTDKYYIPTLEEFHVGFEYEITSGYEWVKKTFCKEDLKSFLYEKLENGINQNLIRVKCLDREDIESLGLEYDNNAEPIPAREYEHMLIPIAYSNGDWMIYHYEHDNVIWIENYKTDSFHFKGTIKNKSELKRILKQLNIK